MADDITSIRSYVTPAGNDKIADWRSDLSVQCRADMDAFIAIMQKTRDWSMPHYRPTIAGYKGLGELRWQSEGVQHRLIGYFSGGTWIALVGCTHKGKIYKPPDAFDIAEKRKGQIERKEAETVQYDL